MKPSRRASLILLVLSLGAPPAFAEQKSLALAADQRPCGERFKAADLNNDGVLTGNEIGNAKLNLPSSLAGKSRITRDGFMAACAGSAS